MRLRVRYSPGQMKWVVEKQSFRKAWPHRLFWPAAPLQERWDQIDWAWSRKDALDAAEDILASPDYLGKSE